MGFLDTIKAAVSGEEQQEKGLIGQIDEAITLTWKQRLIGFASCFGLGVVLSIVSIPFLFSFNISRFAVFYSIGSVLSISSTVFLMGPVKQCQRMFEAHRAIATGIFLLSIGLTLFFAFKFHNAGLCLVMIIIQMSALAWYCLTWIPGGVPAVKAVLGIQSG